MKSFKILIISLLFVKGAWSQSLPNIWLKDLRGESISSKNLLEKDRPTIISFWATWCKPCLQEIKSINENLEFWQKEMNVKFIAISTDDSRSKNRVLSIVNAKKWKFEVLSDENGDFQRAMNVLNIPHTFIFDKNGKLIYQHSSYALGDEKEYFEKLKSLMKSEK